ncbi:calmodulin-regulated spectrin-associated protein 3 [Microcaecilia unicolor]|uniref:Calmodulin-regulated spectrin-associated protein 3 n=1 Tax=Microcaecilia unicolor TaxID=1415580 RepID=A0A6P7XRW5_9AMPH|nr:calmodulin-regulated spectrin-associated protein 3 [Microcaecilia unicolor]
MVDATKAMKKSFLVPEIKPLDQYDFSRAKILANLTWVLAKSYGAESIPEELKEPYYTDQYDQEHIKPPVIRLLLSSDIYCRVYRNMLQPSEDNAAAPRDNASMLHLLSHQGLAPIDQEKMVKDEDLKQKPIKMGSHLAVIDSLMDAFAKESMNMLRAPGGIEQGPGSWEPQLLHWIDKINRKLQESAERNLNQKHIPDSDGQSPSPIRYRKDKVLPKQTPCFPGITSMKDLANGCAIAATIHYYCPKVLQLEDVCLKETMSVADSLYNLQLIRDFCRDYLSGSCPLALEDLLYVPPVLKVNIGAFLAELFLCFEVLKPDFVCPKEAADMKESPGMNNSPSPLSGNSCGSPVFTFQHPFLSKGHLQSPPQRSTGSLNHSTSLSQVEGFGKTWSKKQLSHPLSQAVSFSIPFGLDSDVDIVMGNPVGMMRSVSSDSLAPNVYPTPKKAIQTTYTPSEDVAWYLGQSGENSLVTPPRTVHKVPMSIKSGSQEEEGAGSPMNNGTLDGHSELPTIEEALQIIHNMETRLLPEGAPDGFYLHSPELKEGPQSPQHSQIHTRQTQGKALASPTNMGVYKLHSGSINGCNSSAEVPWTSRDDELGLRDNSLDSDVEDISRGLPAGRELSGKEDSTSDPSSLSSQADSSASSGSGVKMTSFAERKKKMASDSKGDGSPKKVQEDTERGMAPSTTTTWAQKAEESPIKSPSLNSEMNQLGARLEEKRRAIEAQKKRIEAIFTKHRQRLGKSAFLQLKKEEEPEGNTGYLDERPLSLEEHLSKVEAEDDLGSLKTSGEKKAQESNITENKDGEVLSKARSDKQVTFSPEIITGTLDVNLGDYNRAVAKLNSALSSLQMDMHRLSDQQQKLMHKEKSKAWIIPAPKATSSPQPSRDITSPRHMDLSSSPSLPRKTSAPAPRSPQPTPRRTSTTTSVNPKSPKHARPAELKIPPLTRVLTPPQNVDTLPHLRKFSPSKVPMQTRSSIHFADEDQDFDLVKALEAENANHAGDTPQCLDQQGNLRPVASVVPQSSTAVVTASGMDDSSDGISPQGTKQSNLIEIELSTLQPSEDTGGEGEDSLEDVSLDEPEPAHKGGVGFFFKEEKRPEDEMAQRRAALLEKQQKRTEEARRRKQWQETEKEQKKEEASRLQAKEKPQEEEVAGPRRGDFTRQEYMRRQQLKLMDDLDKVLRHKPTTVRAVKKGRPKTVFRDDSVISRSPVRGLLGSKLSKVYSQSTLSLSTVANEPSGNVLSIKRSPRSPRANSPSGLMSPSRLFFTQNGEGDWENASTASSPASIPEYTGPKLYKEPSAKSNKYIIHNALSHCCLAGKVNEPQKNKILEEIEKSKANHFLVLFRDTSCQFRAVYTFSAETEELTRLTGFGPRIISSAMIEGIYKYSSDRKRFTQIPSKTMSMSVDAFTIQGHLWQSKRPTTPKKPGTPK